MVYIVGRKQVKEARSLRSKNVLPVWELVTVAMLSAMPLALYLAAFWLHIGLWDRYLLLAVPGLAILLTSALFQLRDGSGLDADFVLKTAFFFCFVPWTIFRGFVLVLQPSPEQVVQRGAIIPREHGLTVVLSDELVFLQQYFYLPSERGKQITMLVDLAAADKYTGQTCGLRSVAEGSKWWSMPVYNYREFLAGNPEFLLVQSTGPDWLIQELLRDGAGVKLVEDHHPAGTSQAKTEVYLVRTRSGAESARVYDQN